MGRVLTSVGVSGGAPAPALGALGVSAPPPAAASAVPDDAFSAVASASPCDVLGLVREGRLRIDLPLREGPLPGGQVSARKGTVVRLRAVVEHGRICPSKSRVDIVPPLHLEKLGPVPLGFLGLEIQGAHLNRRGGLEVTLEPHGLTALLKPFTRRFTLRVPGVSVPLGMKPLAHLLGGGSERARKGATTGRHASARSSPSPSGEFASAVDLQHARVALADVHLAAGKVQLGGGKVLSLRKGSFLAAKGTLGDLHARGAAEVQGLRGLPGGLTLGEHGGPGEISFEVATRGGTLVNSERGFDFQGHVDLQTRAKNLEVHEGSLVVDLKDSHLNLGGAVQFDGETKSLSVAQGTLGVGASPAGATGLDLTLPMLGTVSPRFSLGDPSLKLTGLDFTTQL